MRLYKIKLLVRYILLLRKYFNFITSFINFLIIAWISPMDCKSVFDLFINLVDEDKDTSNANTTEISDNEKYKQWLLDAFWVTCFIIGLIIWYKSSNMGGGGTGIVDNADNVSININVDDSSSSSSSEISILSDKFVELQNEGVQNEGAGPIISKHW